MRTGIVGERDTCSYLMFKGITFAVGMLSRYNGAPCVLCAREIANSCFPCRHTDGYNGTFVSGCSAVQNQICTYTY